MARRLKELPVYHEALKLCAAVNAILDRPAFGRDRRLRDQISAASESILANMAEGFEQPTDAALERYLFVSKGSTAEVRARLGSAHRRNFITAGELHSCTMLCEEIERMLGGWIGYLARCGWKDRGRRGLKS